MGFVDDVFERRAADAYVNPQVSVDEACVRIRELVPETLAALQAHNFPAHQNSKFSAREIWYEGTRRTAWVLVIESTNVPVTAVRGRSVRYNQVTGAVAVCVTGDDPAVLQLELLYNADVEKFEFTKLVIEQLNPSKAWAVVKLLEMLQKDPKLQPWERP